jgi:hypothetical protein
MIQQQWLMESVAISIWLASLSGEDIDHNNNRLWGGGMQLGSWSNPENYPTTDDASDERSLQVDLVRADRIVPVVGCVGSRDPGPSTPTQPAAAQIPERVSADSRSRSAVLGLR